MRTAKLSLQCRRILGGRNLVRVRNIVVAAILEMTYENVGGLWTCFKGTVVINLITQSISKNGWEYHMFE